MISADVKWSWERVMGGIQGNPSFPPDGIGSIETPTTTPRWSASPT
jgi:hypothetical protein